MMQQKKAAIASFLKYKKIRQHPYGDFLVARPHGDHPSLPGLDFLFGKNNPSTAKYLGKKVSV